MSATSVSPGITPETTRQKTPGTTAAGFTGSGSAGSKYFAFSSEAVMKSASGSVVTSGLISRSSSSRFKLNRSAKMRVLHGEI